MALIGVLAMTTSGGDASAISVTDICTSQGDIFAALAAVCYAVNVVRLGKHSRVTEPVQLATAKAGSQLAFSVLFAQCEFSNRSY